MAKLFVSVVPHSECKSHLDRAIRAFKDVCPCEVLEEPNGMDAVYYMIDETDKHPGLAKVLHDNIVNGKYTSLGFMVKNDEHVRFMYGLYRADIKDDDCTMDQYVKEAG